ncbi:MAG: ABC transporter substrate-binding protein [Dehalococcoidales bacterium]
MKHRIIWFGLAFVLVAALLLASCGTASTTTNVTTSTTTTIISTTTSTTSAVVPTTTTPTAITSTVTTSATGNWWDSLGIPQYGGTITVSQTANMVQWDPYATGGTNVLLMYLQQMDSDNWTVSPSSFAFQFIFRPPEDLVGSLATSWTMPDVNDFVVTIRQNVYWQNISPVNGRQFTAADVVYDMDRMYGLGGGFTTPSPYASSDVISRAAMNSVTQTAPWTVDFHWNAGNPENILETQLDQGTASQDYVAQEAVTLWGNLNDWHHAIGTGPFILTDFVDSSSATFARNPNYWGYDERYPANKLPYASNVKILIIPTVSTALAALRTGKIDLVEGNSIQASTAMKSTNPEIVQVPIPQAAEGLSMCNTQSPYNSLQVREACQLAQNLPLIAQTYYNGTVAAIPQTLTLSTMGGGWGDPYPNWPADLQAQFAYNPTLAKSLLAQAGYPNGFSTTCLASGTSDLDLMQILLNNLAAIGITVSVTVLDPNTWSTTCISNKKATALTFCDGRPFGNAYSPIRQLQLFRTGYGGDYSLVSDPTFDAFYPAAIAATDITTIKQIVANANLYVAQQHFGVSSVSPNFYSFVQPWLKGYNGQNGSASSGFYLSRFWVASH